MCDFCKGKETIKATSIIDKRRANPMNYMFGSLVGLKIEEFGIRLVVPNNLCFDNSCGEYNEGVVEIKYCPMCGRKL